MYAYITLPVYSFQNFIYKVPTNLKSKIYSGVCVNVFFRKKLSLGYIVELTDKVNYKGKILSIDSVNQHNFNIPTELWETLKWTSNYYIAPFGQVIKSSIPQNFSTKYKLFKKEYVCINNNGILLYKQWNKKAPLQKRILEYLYKNTGQYVELSSLSNLGPSYKKVCNDFINNGYINYKIKTTSPFIKYQQQLNNKIQLNQEQENAYKKIVKKINKNIFFPCYLKGVTGSGKTEVYLKLAISNVQQKKSVIILVPEIALTPLLFQKFYNTFKDKVALWHSGLSKSEKGWVWQQIRKGKISVIVGARSAVFLPMKNLGMIVVDEEQESSYKQENPSPRYNARDISLVRAKFSNSIVLLTSATPSLESYYNCINKKFNLFELKKRYGESIYPEIRLINMRSNFNDRINFSQYLSRELVIEINNTISRGEQVILLHNRRGYAYVQICKTCEWIFNCPDCSISLTYHKMGNTMLCHHCNYKTNMKSQCLNCDSYELEIIGHGTQKIEDEINSILPNSKIIRLDVDSSKRKDSHYKILNKFQNQEYNILLGTQMIAKGLDFNNVTFVGIVNADIGLFLPDFRSGEKIFQLIYQVAGRSGRRKKQGKVFIQTYNPDDIYIKTASNLDLEKFYKIALHQRNELWYPPFNRICKILFQGNNKLETQKFSEKIGKKIKDNNFIVLGPSIAPIEKIKGLWRFHLLIKISHEKPFKFQNFIKNKMGFDILQKKHNGIKISLDIDPINLL